MKLFKDSLGIYHHIDEYGVDTTVQACTMAIQKIGVTSFAIRQNGDNLNPFLQKEVFRGEANTLTDDKGVAYSNYEDILNRLPNFFVKAPIGGADITELKNDVSALTIKLDNLEIKGVTELINKPNGYAGLDAAKKLANDVIRTDFRMSQGYIFDGVDDYLTIPHNDKLNFGDGDFTFQFYGIPKTNVNAQLYRDITIVNGAPVGISIAILYGKIEAYVYGGGLSDSFFYYDVNVGVPLHIIITRKGESLFLYVNGLLAKTSTSRGLNVTSNSDIELFRYVTKLYKGTGYLVRLFNRGFSQQDVTYYENNGRPDLQRLKYEDVITNYGELVTNGTFDSVNGWRQYPNDTPTLSNGRIVSTSTGTSYNGGVYSQLARSVELGKRYRLKFDVESNAVYTLVSGFSINSGSIYNPFDYITQIGITKIIKEKIIIDKSCDTIILYPSYYTASSVSYDNISVKQLGCVLELLPENALPERWLESQNGLDAITNGSPAINTDIPITDTQIVDNVTNDIAVGTFNREYTLPAGYIVDSVCVNSTVALTALQLVNITTTETLLTGKTASASANKHLPITADQSSSKVNTTIRLNCAGNTGLGFNIVINIKKCL